MARSFLRPFEFRGGIACRNRLALPGLTNCQSKADGSLGADELTWLTSRARGGFGLVSTCATYVADHGKGFEGQLGISNDEHVAGLTELAAALVAEGTIPVVQLFHGGVRAPSKITGSRPWSASEYDLTFKGFERPRAASADDIHGLIAEFAAAAKRASDAGFAGVEVHGAHGYLLTQFLGTVTNTRDDEWGGSLENRARLIRRVFAACREATPPSFLVGVRISPEVAEQGVDFDESLEVARWLADDGADFIHLSVWDAKRPTKYPDDDRHLTRWFRDALGPDVVVIATGGVWTADDADAMIANGADIVGLGRAAIANPTWPKLAAEPGFEPVRPPITPAEAAEISIGPAFAKYLRRFRFVSD